MFPDMYPHVYPDVPPNASSTLPTQFVAPGEALTDLIRTSGDQWASKVGGAAWNVARVMAHLGVPSAFIGAISQDVFGDALWQASVQAGLDMRFIQRYPQSPLLAIVHETQPPQYFFIGDNSADLHFTADALPANWHASVQWAHFGGISLTRPPLADRLIELACSLKAAGCRISYDPNFRVVMDARYDATFRRMAALADVVKVSDEDLAGLFRTNDLHTAFSTLRSWNPTAAYLYTRGAAGASLHIGDQTWHAAPPAINVVDSVGAGDASIGGLLYSLMQTPPQPWATHLAYAVAAGAAACCGAGATPPSLALIQSLLSQIKIHPGEMAA